MTSLSRLQQFYSDLEAEALIGAMANEFEGKIAAFSSFGAYSVLLLDMVAKVDPNIPVLFLETEKHFRETLEYVEQVRDLLGLTDLRMLHPDPEMVARIDPDGNLWQSSVDRCCHMRKVEPLARHLDEHGFEAVITGRRRYQTADRKDLEKIELDVDGRFRVNPVGFWSREQIIEEFDRRGLPQHPLVAKGFPSIGCEPCTREVKPGEDYRSGRWAHTIDIEGKQKTECGIHVVGAGETDWSV